MAPADTDKGKGLERRSRRRIRHLNINHTSSGQAIPDGYCSQDTATQIWIAGLEALGFGETSTEQRQEIINALVEVVYFTTSVETDWATTHMYVDGRHYPLQPLVSVCAEKIKSQNPFRVWIRSFNNQEIPARIFDFLSNPENKEERARVMLAYPGVSEANVQWAFDTADSLVLTDRVKTQTDVQKINECRVIGTMRASTQASARGEIGVAHDNSGKLTASASKLSSAATVTQAPAPTRLALSSVR